MNSLNPQGLSPDDLAAQIGPFGSWPKQGLPEGYFKLPMSAQAADFYRENGWVVIHEGFSSREVDEIISNTSLVCRNDDNAIEGITPAGKSMSDIESMRRVLCIHFPHKLNNFFKKLLSHDSVVEVLKGIIGPNVKCMQSMLFVKASGKPGQAWHQDEDFIPTRDRSLVGAWVALDDATIENGCLWILSKSHKRGLLWPQKFHFDNRFDCTHESFDFPWKDEDSVPVEVKAGSIVFFNGYTLHRSLPNKAKQGFRRSLVNHYMNADSLLPWVKPDEKTTMALADYRDIVMVAGEDPFAYKGTTEIAKAFVRADGTGGCVDWNDDEQKKKAQIHKKN